MEEGSRSYFSPPTGTLLPSDPSSSHQLLSSSSGLKTAFLPSISPPSPERSTHSSFLLFSFLVASYFMLGTLFFFYFEKDWTFFDSFYFVMITFLTIGFGDFAPTCGVTKLFVCVYIFLGLTIIASGVKYILDILAKKNQELQQQMILRRLEFETQVATTSTLPSVPLSSSAPSRIQSYLMTKLKLTKSQSTICEDLLTAFLIIFANILVGILCHKYIFDELPLVDSIYLSVITITTLGYGDIVPRTTSSRGFTLLYAFIGVLSTARAVSLVNDASAHFFTPTRGPAEKEEIRDTELEQHEFFDRNEFVLYKLTKMGILTPDLRSHIEELFGAMDVAKSGLISNHDILKFRDLLHHESSLHGESFLRQ